MVSPHNSTTFAIQIPRHHNPSYDEPYDMVAVVDAFLSDPGCTPVLELKSVKKCPEFKVALGDPA